MTDILVSQYIQIDHFLTPTVHHHLLEYVLQQADRFVPTSTSTNAIDYRQSQVLYEFPEIAELVDAEIQAILPTIYPALTAPLFTIGEIEMQLTAHNDGNYYKVHNDNGSPDTATREFTYVYYFYHEPKAFSGGELIIYDSQIESGFYQQAESWHRIEPRNNSVVFFLSRCLHEVLPVYCPSRRFEDSRFTINGWVRR